MNDRLNRPVAIPLALGALIFAACGDDEEDKAETSATPAAGAKGVFVGRVSGTDAYIVAALVVALVSNGRQLRTGYLCDSKRVSRWLGKTGVAGQRAALRGRNGKPLGTVRLSKGAASGTVTLAGGEHAFRATPARGSAGLYREAKGATGKPGSSETGWIVLADGSVRGATNFIDREDDLRTGKAASKPTAGAEFIETGTEL